MDAADSFQTLAIDDLMTLGAGGNNGDMRAELLLDEQHIVLRGLGKVFPLGGPAEVALPAGEGGVDGLCRLKLGSNRKIVPSIS